MMGQLYEIGQIIEFVDLIERRRQRPQPSTGAAWYILITNPNCHARAEKGLAAVGYQSFWPKVRKWVCHARTKIPKEYPILGRYLFVEIPDREFFKVRAVNGVASLLVGDSGAPAMIACEVVWAFRERYMAGEWDLVENGTGHIPVGARIQIMEGEFADLLTVVRGRKNGKLKFLPPGRREFQYTRESNARAA